MANSSANSLANLVIIAGLLGFGAYKVHSKVPSEEAHRAKLREFVSETIMEGADLESRFYNALSGALTDKSVSERATDRVLAELERNVQYEATFYDSKLKLNGKELTRGFWGNVTKNSSEFKDCVQEVVAQNAGELLKDSAGTVKDMATGLWNKLKK